MKRSFVIATALAMTFAQLFLPFGPTRAAQLGENSYQGQQFPFSITWSDEWFVEDEPTFDGGIESFSLTNGPSLVIFQATDAPFGTTQDFLQGLEDSIASEPTISNIAPAEDADGNPVESIAGERSYRAVAYDQEIEGQIFRFVAMLDVWQLVPGESVLANIMICEEGDFATELPKYFDLMTGLRVGSSAQPPEESTPEVVPTETTPEPEATVGPANIAQAFVSGKWQISVAGARQAAAINAVGLRRQDGSEWVIVIADLANWSSRPGRIAPDEFVLLADGNEVAISANETVSVAQEIGLEIDDASAPVRLEGDESTRFVLVFQVDEGATDLALSRAGNSLPLESTLLNVIDFNDLPPVQPAPELTRAEVDSVATGDTILVFTQADNQEHAVHLIGVEVPECYAGQATVALEEQAGDTIFLEEEVGATGGREIDRYVWIERDNGTRQLLDHWMIANGNAEHASDDTGRYSTWLTEAESTARSAGEGLWTACATPTATPEPTETPTPEATETPVPEPTEEATEEPSPQPSPEALEIEWLFRGNAARTGELPGPGLTSPATFPWQFRIGAPVLSSPAVVDGVVYVGSDNSNLYALDSFSGPAKWIFTAGGPISSSPAVAGGTVYVGSEDNNLYAINAETGKERWRFETGNAISSSPAVAGGVVYFESDDGNLYAVDAATSEQLWKTFVGQASFASPAVVDSTVYVAGGRDLYAVNALTGEVIWQFDMLGFAQASPAVADGMVFAGNGNGDFFAVDAETGDAIWRFQADDGVVASPAVADGVVYLASLDQNIYALDAETGDELWSFAAGDQFAASPIVSDGVVYAASFDTYLYGLDAKSGEERMRLQVGLTLASPVIVDGVIYTASADGVVQARRPFDLFGVAGSSAATPVPVATKAPESEQTVSVTLGPGTVFEPNQITIQAGSPATVVLENQDNVPHTFVIDELNINEAIEPGELATVTLDVKAGTYTFYCEIPGHREGGMEGTLVVE